jgi:hypothetical protein
MPALFYALKIRPPEPYSFIAARKQRRSAVAHRFKTNLALEGEKALLVLLSGGYAELDSFIEQAVAAAARTGKPVRVLVGEITRMPAFFKQVDDLIVRYFRPDDFASFPRTLDDLCCAHRGYPAVVCGETAEIAEESA